MPSLALYVAMAGSVSLALPLFNSDPLLYPMGHVFHANDERWRHLHSLWRLFVLGGTACHYFTVLYFVG